MRTLTFDQFEFDHPSSEESLVISLASRSEFPFPTPASFAAACVGTDDAACLGVPVKFSEHFGYGKVREYLSRFAAVTVPENCLWPCYVLAEGPDEWKIIIEAPGHFICYHWSTSA